MEYCEFGKMWVLGLLLALIAKTTSENVPAIDIAVRDDNREVYCPMHCFCDKEYAHCGNGGFTTFPVNLDIKVKHIMLENNKIRTLRNGELGYYRQAESITLYGNQIDQIERGAFDGLTNLKTLNLGRNRLRRIDKSTFAGLENLKILIIENNDLEELSSGLYPLQKLRVLRAGSNRITALRNGDFTYNSGLRRLNVSFNQIRHMDRDVLKPIPYLRYLILNHNPLGDSASNLNLENNRWIYFVDLSNTELRFMIRNLPPTTYDVRLQNNQIERLSREDFSNATFLDMLILNDNQLREIEPGALDHLQYLRELWLTRNRLQRFPRLPHNVRAVHLDNNDIRQIQTRDLETSPNVEFLYLQNNNIQRIARESFKDMGFLRALNLRQNQLGELESYTFVNLTNLDSMDLSINPIRKVDRSSFSQLTNLRRLQMARVEQLTEARDLDMLQRMTHLQILDFSLSPGLAQSLVLSDVILPKVIIKQEFHFIPTVNELFSLLSFFHMVKNIFS
jgi:Leucine-rich repeat (LRR) protein